MDVERCHGEEERRIAAFLHRLPSSERGQPEGRVALAANRHVPEYYARGGSRRPTSARDTIKS